VVTGAGWEEGVEDTLSGRYCAAVTSHNVKSLFLWYSLNGGLVRYTAGTYAHATRSLCVEIGNTLRDVR